MPSCPRKRGHGTRHPVSLVVSCSRYGREKDCQPMSLLFPLDKRRWYLRFPVKWAIFTLTVLGVCFPYPHILVRHVQHWSDPQSLVEPDAPGIVEMVSELQPQLRPELSARETLKVVERFVYKKIDYAYDWETWGTADYIPTGSEALDLGREDCDGRAVVAASMLQRLGYKAELVTDFTHVWVKTDKGETMGPGKTKAIIATDEGLKMQRGALGELPKALAYGVAVFPLERELIVLVVAWWLLLQPRGNKGFVVVSLMLLIGGLLFLRFAGRDHTNPAEEIQLIGLAGMTVGLLALLVRPRTSEATPPAGSDQQA